MKHLAVLTGVVLIAIGLFGYLAPSGSGNKSKAGAVVSAQQEAAANESVKKRSPTALIPAAVGALIVLLGCAAHRPAWHKHAMHAAAAVALLGAMAAAGRGIPAVISTISEQQSPSLAVICLCLMFLVCAVFVLLCLRSFVVARRRPQT